MGYKMQDRVWAHSPQKGASLLVLLALARYQHDDASVAFPSVPTLARDTRMSERQVQRILVGLVAEGEVERIERGGPKGVSAYRVLSGPDKLSPPEPQVVTLPTRMGDVPAEVVTSQMVMGDILSEGGVILSPKPGNEPGREPEIEPGSNPGARVRASEPGVAPAGVRDDSPARREVCPACQRGVLFLDNHWRRCVPETAARRGTSVDQLLAEIEASAEQAEPAPARKAAVA